MSDKRNMKLFTWLLCAVFEALVVIMSSLKDKDIVTEEALDKFTKTYSIDNLLQRYKKETGVNFYE